MICYRKEDVEELSAQDGEYSIPSALFDTMQYKLIRLEVKWAYVACMNVMLKSPSYDKDGRAYIKDDHPQIVEVLKDLAHKVVDREKVAGYLVELEECGLVERDGRNLYLKKICNIF